MMDQSNPTTWQHVRTTRQFVDGRLVGSVPTVFLKLGPIFMPIPLAMAEHILEELCAVIEHLRVMTRATQERN